MALLGLLLTGIALVVPQSGEAYYLAHTPVLAWAPPCHSTSDGIDLIWLSCRAAQVIKGCQLTGKEYTVLFTPDASHGYGAQWTRDFYYTVAGAADLMDSVKVKRAVEYTFWNQRADGCMPDRVRTDGIPIMAPGGDVIGRNPDHDHAWDNGPFAALLLAVTVEAWPDKEFFCKLEPSARRALDFVNRSANSLVFNDVLWPNCTYGFTDTIAKTGNLLFTSLLFIDASRRMAALAEKYGCGNAERYSAEASAASASVDVMKDPSGPLWLAATADNALPDVWGSAYLVALNLSTAERQILAMQELVTNKAKYFRGGQVRSLPRSTFWNRCCWKPNCNENQTDVGCPAKGTYQNGAYWATPLPYIVKALVRTGNYDFAVQLVSECIRDFKYRGIYEDVGFDQSVPSLGVLNYTASATNVFWAAKFLSSASDLQDSPVIV